MVWNLEKVKHEIHVFAEHAREIIGSTEGVEQIVECPVEISTRMTSTKGRFNFNYIKQDGEIIGITPTKITIAQSLLNNYYDEDIIDVIRHECVHLIVNVDHKKNMGHNKVFKEYCRNLGISDETYFTAEPKKRTGAKKKTSTRKTKKVAKVRTKNQLISSMYKMKAYELSEMCGHTDNFDSVWWDMLLVYDNIGWGELTQRQVDSLYKWLVDGQKYCEESYSRNILVNRVYVPNV